MGKESLEKGQHADVQLEDRDREAVREHKLLCIIQERKNMWKLRKGQYLPRTSCTGTGMDKACFLSQTLLIFV